MMAFLAVGIRKNKKNLPFYELFQTWISFKWRAEWRIEVWSENVTGTDWEAKLCAKVVKKTDKIVAFSYFIIIRIETFLDIWTYFFRWKRGHYTWRSSRRIRRWKFPTFVVAFHRKTLQKFLANIWNFYYLVVFYNTALFGKEIDDYCRNF